MTDMKRMIWLGYVTLAGSVTTVTWALWPAWVAEDTLLWMCIAGWLVSYTGVAALRFAQSVEDWFHSRT